MAGSENIGVNLSGITVDSIIEPRKYDYKNELIFYFFNSMLEAIVDSWEALGDIDCVESISSTDNIFVEPEDCASTEVEDTIDTESHSRYSLMKTSQQIIEDFKKIRNESTISEKARRRSAPVRKSRKSGRKRTMSIIRNIEQQSQYSDTSWIIEPIDEYVIIKFKNGNIYEGPVAAKLMHGVGKFTWANGTTYTGNFDHGDLTGKGELILPDRSCYDGEFLRGYRHGHGVMFVTQTGAAYKGGWRAGMKHNHGWQLFQPNEWYDGDWVNDYMEGNGIRQYASGARYQGHWKHSMRHGKGYAIMKNNDFYTGDWVQGKRRGFGEYTWNSFYNKTLSIPVESTYIGSWNKNQMDGIGLINFGTEGGARYAGCFLDNQKHGAGVILCDNGSSIESNPLFLYDKPVHVTQTGSVNLSVGGESHVKICESSQISSGLLNIIKNTISVSCLDNIIPEKKLSVYQIITKQIYLPTNHLDNATIANIELCKLAFPKIQENYYSLCIPINTPSEMIVLTHYLKIISGYLGSRNSNQWKDFNSVFSDIKVPHHCCSDSPKYIKRSPVSYTGNTSSSVLKEQIDYEEKNLRKAITTYLPKLRSIYTQYSTLACLKILPFKTLMIRLFLWQFYRDCKIPQKGISLINIDDLMLDNPDTELVTQHGPFEVIYFWQFLHSIIILAVTLYAKECSGYTHEGILKTAFIKFLDEDIFPNYGHHIGSALFDYVDVLPLKSVYKWYQQYKEPFTALKFLENSSTIRRRNPPSYFGKLKKAEDITVRLGVNTYGIGHELTYLQDDIPSIQTSPIEEDIKISDDEPFKGLYFLRSLGAKTVLTIIDEICPSIKINNDIVNMQHELTFLDFYEVVLQCTQTYIDRENKKKLKEKLAEEEKNLQAYEHLSVGSIKGRKGSKSRRPSKKKIQIQNI